MLSIENTREISQSEQVEFIALTYNFILYSFIKTELFDTNRNWINKYILTSRSNKLHNINCGDWTIAHTLPLRKLTKSKTSFALAPGLVDINQPIDYATRVGTELYRAGTNALPTTFDGEA